MHQNVLYCVLVGSLSAACGCASIRSKVPGVPDIGLLKSQPKDRLQSKQPLGSPENQSMQIALQTARLAEERSMDNEAIAAYEKVRQLDPKQPGVAHALAVLYDRAARTDAASREYAAALQESPKNVDLLCDYGYFLYSTGKLDEAEQTLRLGTSINVNHQQTTVNLAVVLATRKRYDEAKTLFEQAIGPAAALHNIGMFKLRQGEATEGQQMIAAAAQQDPSLGQSRTVLENVANLVGRPHLAADKKGLQR